MVLRCEFGKNSMFGVVGCQIVQLRLVTPLSISVCVACVLSCCVCVGFSGVRLIPIKLFTTINCDMVHCVCVSFVLPVLPPWLRVPRVFTLLQSVC